MSQVAPPRRQRRFDRDGLAQRSLRTRRVLGRVAGIAQCKPAHPLTRPLLHGGLIGTTGGTRMPGLLQIGGCLQPGAQLGLRRQPLRRQGQHRPASATRPGRVEAGEVRHPAPGGAGAQDQLALVPVVAHQHGEVPARIPVERQILQDQHRVPRRHFGQQGIQPRRQRVDQQIVVARRRHQLDLQAALASGQEHPILEQARRGDHAALIEHGRQRGRSALVLGLREERHITQLDPLRQQTDLCRQLRRTCAAAKQQAGQQQAERLQPQRLMHLTKEKMSVAQSRSVIMKITRNNTMIPMMPPAGASLSC
ncbi:hypothetical protein D3C78_1154740 [compost metagenome]